MDIRVDGNGLALSLHNVLAAYKKASQKAVDECVGRFSQRLLQDVRESAPFGSRGGPKGGRKIDYGRSHFADTARLNMTGTGAMGAIYTLHFVKPGSGLAHLLENGHVGRDGEFVAGRHFIRNALEKGEPILMQELAAALGNSGGD